MDEAMRTQWRESWRSTVCEIAVPGGWRAMREEDLPDPSLVVTAWNPASRQLPDEVNRARDGVLRAELDARDMPARRVRGRSPGGEWHEDGWLVAQPSHLVPRLVPDLLRRYGQLAAFVFARGGRGLSWEDGAFDWLEAPDR